MNATSFEFTMTMPGDARLVGAVRDLATHAAGYAQLEARAADAVVADVVAATEALIGLAAREAAPVEYRFRSESDGLHVTVSCEAPGQAPPSGAGRAGGRVEWTRDGALHTCLIRQPRSA